MKRFLALAALPLVLSLSACGETASSMGDTDADALLKNGSISRVTFDVGLRCDAYDTNVAGGVDCDWASLTLPANWDKVGSVQSQDSDAGTVELVRFADGHLCVTLDGNESRELRLPISG